MGSFSKTSDEKGIHLYFDSQQVDTGAQLDASLQTPLDSNESLRLRRKIDWHILPLMCTVYCIQQVDKTSLGSSAILGIIKDTHLTTDQYNWLGTIFFVGYLAFAFPQNLALQRFPVRKWMSLNIFIWGVTLCSHAACKNFASLFVARFVLGICEGSITAGFVIVSCMFYTRREHTVRVGCWYLMIGTAPIIGGFLSFGTLHIHTTGFEPWQWLMIIIGILTVVVAIIFFLLFPDSPTDAWFLTYDERAKAVQRIKENQTGVENKHFKKSQMIEALTDPKTWLFALLTILTSIPGSLNNQFQIIIASFGFNLIQTTLLGCVNGVVVVVVLLTCVSIVSRTPNSIAWVGMAFYVPAILGVFLVNFLPWRNKVGLLFAVWITLTSTAGFMLTLSWVSQTTAGHTKRVTTNAIVLSTFCIGNAVGPFMWRYKYKPRNHLPWIIIGICFLLCTVVFFSIRVLLARENKRRDAEPPDKSYDDVYVAKIDEEGNHVEVKVSKEFLDLTDRQNRDFRYVL